MESRVGGGQSVVQLFQQEKLLEESKYEQLHSVCENDPHAVNLSGPVRHGRKVRSLCLLCH